MRHLLFGLAVLSISISTHAAEFCKPYDQDILRTAWGRSMNVMRDRGKDCQVKSIQLEYSMGRIENPDQAIAFDDVGIWVRINGVSNFFTIPGAQRCNQSAPRGVDACARLQPISRGGFMKIASIYLDQDAIRSLFGDGGGEIEFALVANGTWDSRYGHNYRAFARQ